MKKIFTTSLTTFLLGLSLTAFGQTTIQMRKEGGVFTVPCKVNGLDLRFIFDTGASDVSISLTEALFMLKNGQLTSSDILGKEVYQNATGDLSVGTKIILREILFSGLTLYNVEASIVHELSAPLLLGQSAMSKLGKFQFDPNNGLLTIMNGTSNSYTFTTQQTNTNNKIFNFKTQKAIGAPSVPNENQFEFIGSLNDGLACVKQNGLYGFIDKNGKIVIPIKYVQALCFMHGVAEVIDNANGTNISYYIDTNGNRTNRTYRSN